MLIRFSVSNWKCFRDQTTLSMVAGRELQHKERLPFINKYKLRLLPMAAIYGGNASGKTKFFDAIAFAQNFITSINQPDSLILRESFKLDSKFADIPSTFTFELLINDQCYEFSFSVTHQKVIEEKLSQISPYSRKELYRRDTRLTTKKVTFGDRTLEEDQRLHFVAEGTRDNQLFLTNSINQNLDCFKPVYNWFKNSLSLISPTSPFLAFDQWMNKDGHLHGAMNEALSQLDTGIICLEGKRIDLESQSFIKPDQLEELKAMPEGKSLKVISGTGGRFIITKKGGELYMEKMVSSHSSSDGKKIYFDLMEESAGTLRTIDLLPAFLDLQPQESTTASKVYFIDELDRCLHPLLTRQLLIDYLRSCSPNTRSQLLFTTHEIFLMDQEILRRDEIWVTERDPQGCSTLFSFSDFKEMRYDKDIRKSYLQGRLGGVQKVLLLNLASTHSSKTD